MVNRKMLSLVALATTTFLSVGLCVTTFSDEQANNDIKAVPVEKIVFASYSSTKVENDGEFIITYKDGCAVPITFKVHGASALQDAPHKDKTRIHLEKGGYIENVTPLQNIKNRLTDDTFRFWRAFNLRSGRFLYLKWFSKRCKQYRKWTKIC